MNITGKKIANSMVAAVATLALAFGPVSSMAGDVHAASTSKGKEVKSEVKSTASSDKAGTGNLTDRKSVV